MADPKNKLEAMSDEAPFPAEVDDADAAVEAPVEEGVEEAVPPFVDFAVDFAVDWLPETELVVALDPEAVEVDDELDDDDRLSGSVTLAHERSNNGVVLKLLSLLLVPRRPKLGFGLLGAASCRTYHQVLILSKADAHPT